MSPDGRRIKGEGSIYQRKDGRWVGVVDLGWVGDKRVRKTVTAATVRELRPKFRALKNRVEKGVLSDDATVEQWFTYWLDHIAARDVRPRTLLTYRGYVAKWVTPALGRQPLRKVRPEHVRAVYEAMWAAGRKDATVRQVHAIMSKGFSEALMADRILRNPVKAVKPPKVGTDHHAAMSADDAIKVLAVARDTEELARLGVALCMGLRQSEALGLTWLDLDLTVDGGLAHVERSLQRVAHKGLVVQDPKSRASTRSVPIIAPLAQALMLLRTESGGAGYVFGGVKGRDPRADWQMWKDAQARAGVQSTPLHGARATTATLLGKLGVPERVIADILGHRTVAVTQEHYIRSDPEQRRQALEGLGVALAWPEALPGSLGFN